jgi:uncharacterized protein YecT (DUF1311 family)
MYPVALAALVILGWPGWAMAEDKAEINPDAFQAFATANQELKAVIASYRPRLGQSQQLLFDKSQEAWDRYRDAFCEFYSSGSVASTSHPVVFLECLEFFTRDRLETLKLLITCKEGDRRCPVLKGDI